MRRLGTLGVIAIPFILVVVIGLLLSQAPRTVLIIKLDPTIRFWLAAAALGLPYIMGFNVFERLLARLAPAPQNWWKALVVSWIAILAVLGTINLLVAFTTNDVTWVNFKLGLTGLFWVAGLILLYMHFGRKPA